MEFLSIFPGTMLLLPLVVMQLDAPISVCGSRSWIEVPPIIIDIKIISPSKGSDKHFSTISTLHYTSRTMERNKRCENIVTQKCPLHNFTCKSCIPIRVTCPAHCSIHDLTTLTLLNEIQAYTNLFVMLNSPSSCLLTHVPQGFNSRSHPYWTAIDTSCSVQWGGFSPTGGEKSSNTAILQLIKYYY
jgi:hypothetical protein